MLTAYSERLEEHLVVEKPNCKQISKLKNGNMNYYARVNSFHIIFSFKCVRTYNKFLY